MQAERDAAPGWRKFVKNGMWRRTFAGFSVQAVSKLLGIIPIDTLKTFAYYAKQF